ncbi:MAG: ComEC/Rec2 family competence protein [Longilinea sp.]|nr:ComEC/Rec2 family competence protein [Longilinea sp.]
MPPLLWLSLAWVGGVVLASGLKMPAWAWGLAAMVGIALTWLARRAQRRSGLSRRFPLPPGVLLAVLALGGLRWQLAQPVWSSADLAWVHRSHNAPTWACLSGIISSDPDKRPTQTYLRLRAEALQDEAAGWRPVRGQLLIITTPGEWRYGDRLLVCGSLDEPGSNERFSYRDFLARQGVYSLTYYPRLKLLGRDAGNPILAALYRLRQTSAHTLEKLFPQPEAALLSGILLGLENDIPPALQEAFRATGTAHIVAISGFNMTLLAGLFISFFSRITRRGWAALLAGLALLFYTVLVGGSAGVVRAAVMACLGLLGHLLGRRQSGPTSLSFTAAVMTLFNPTLPWDVSFQLSFMATLGLVLYADPLQQGFIRLLERRLTHDTAQRLAGPIGEYVLFTLAAQVTTLPVTVYHFQHVSLSTLLANPLILPVQPLVMILGGLALLGGLVWLPLGQALALMALLPVSYTIRVVEWLGQLPGSDQALGEVPLWLVIAFYLLLFGLSLKGLRQRLGPIVQLGAALLIAGVAVRAALTAPTGEVQLTIWEADGTPMVLLHTPTGKQVLLNVAAEAPPLRARLGRSLPPLRPNLDGIILTASRSTTLDGLSDLLATNPSRAVWLTVPPSSGRSLTRLQRLCLQQGTTLQTLLPGQGLQVDRDLQIHLLARSSTHAALLLEYGQLRLLIPGGVSPKDLQRQANILPGGWVVLLGKDDLPMVAAWQAFAPQVILATLPEQQAQSGWVSVAGQQSLRLFTDGQALRMVKSNAP